MALRFIISCLTAASSSDTTRTCWFIASILRAAGNVFVVDRSQLLRYHAQIIVGYDIKISGIGGFDPKDWKYPFRVHQLREVLQTKLGEKTP